MNRILHSSAKALLASLAVADGSIFGHLAVTLYETFSGFFIGAVFGIGLGFVLGGDGIRRRKSVVELLSSVWGSWHLVWNEEEDIPLRAPLAARGEE